MSKDAIEYIQYGCGTSSYPEGWLNFDASPTLFIQRIPLIGGFVKRIVEPRFPDDVIYGDIVRGLPIGKASYRGVYCSHVLEHLSLEDFRIAIANTYNYLKPGGIFRLVMPDMFRLAQQYVISNNTNASIIFLNDSLLGVTKRDRSIISFLRDYLGNSRHLWLWDFKSAKSELEYAGFIQIRNANFGDSLDPRFQEVEDKSRWDDCLGIECIK